MDHDELVRLSGLAREGDIEARNRIVEAHLWVIRAVLAERGGSGPPCRASVADRADLSQEGVIALVRSAALWDPGRGVKFCSYAGRAIRNGIADARRKSQTIHPADVASKRATRWRRMAGRGMAEPEIVAAMGIDAAEAARVKAALAAQSVAVGPLAEWSGEMLCDEPGPLEELISEEEWAVARPLLPPEPKRRPGPDLTGREYGRLVVEGFSGHRDGYGKKLWRCRCKCGGTKDVLAYSLRAGQTRSCGCLAGDEARRRRRASVV